MQTRPTFFSYFANISICQEAVVFFTLKRSLASSQHVITAGNQQLIAQLDTDVCILCFFFLSFNLFIYFYSPGAHKLQSINYLPQCHQVTKKNMRDISSFLLIYVMAASSPHPPICLTEEAFQFHFRFTGREHIWSHSRII